MFARALLVTALSLALLSPGCGRPAGNAGLTGHNDVLIRAGLKGQDLGGSELMAVDAATGRIRDLREVGGHAQWIPGTDRLLSVLNRSPGDRLWPSSYYGVIVIRRPDGSETEFCRAPIGRTFEEVLALGAGSGVVCVERDWAKPLREQSRVVLTDANGTRVQSPEELRGWRTPLSPNGKYLICVGRSVSQDRRQPPDLYVWDITSGAYKRLPDLPYGATSPWRLKWTSNPLELRALSYASAGRLTYRLCPQDDRWPGAWERFSWLPLSLEPGGVSPDGSTVVTWAHRSPEGPRQVVGLLDSATHKWRYRTPASDARYDFCEKGCHLALIASRQRDPAQPLTPDLRIIDTRTGHVVRQLRLPGVTRLDDVRWGYPYYAAATSATPTVPTTEGSGAARPSKRGR
jgi:hypothetical protein